MVKKRQVKLTLDETVYQELKQEALQKGLSLASYLRLLICQKDLHKKTKNVKMKKPTIAKQKKILQELSNIW